MAKQYWIMKTEPDTFSIDDLAKRPEQTEGWDGVRNYQARNYMRDSMKIGDRVLFYHSNCKPMGIVGEAEIFSEALPDFTALNPESPYHDAKATRDQNPWVLVKVHFIQKFPKLITLESLKSVPGLEDMVLLRKGSRLSIQPVSAEEYRIVFALSRKSELK